MAIFGFLGSLLGYVLWGAFCIFKNFGLSMIVFTLIIKVVLFPFSVKQQKSMAGTARLSKKQKELQEKYKNNQQKLQEETSKLYEKEGVKPMGGCLTTLVPFLVLFGIFYAVAYPLTNTLHLNSDEVSKAISYINTIPGYVTSANPTYQEISLIKIFPNIMNTEAIKGIFSASDISTIQTFQSGFNTYGVDLLAIPKEYGLLSWYTLFPIINLVATLASQMVTQKINGNQMTQQNGCMNLMLYGMPLFSAWITYSVPCAMALYWIVSSVFGLIQSVVLGKIFSTAKLTANAEARHVALMLENESKVPYVYAPQGYTAENNIKNSKKKK